MLSWMIAPVYTLQAKERFLLVFKEIYSCGLESIYIHVGTSAKPEITYLYIHKCTVLHVVIKLSP